MKQYVFLPTHKQSFDKIQALCFSVKNLCEPLWYKK